jgi:hypothetical protein
VLQQPFECNSSRAAAATIARGGSIETAQLSPPPLALSLFLSLSSQPDVILLLPLYKCERSVVVSGTYAGELVIKRLDRFIGDMN